MRQVSLGRGRRSDVIDKTPMAATTMAARMSDDVVMSLTTVGKATHSHRRGCARDIVCTGHAAVCQEARSEQAPGLTFHLNHPCVVGA